MWAIAFALLAACAGWGLAYARHCKPVSLVPARSTWAQTIYVLFLNKFYVDEFYTAFIVVPTIRFSRWLWRVVDVRVIDGLIQELTTASVGLARWLWRVVDSQGIDRLVVASGTGCVALAHSLWRIIDVRAVRRTDGRPAGSNLPFAWWTSDPIDLAPTEPRADQNETDEASCPEFRNVEPRTLQHHLLLLIVCLLAAIVFLYRFVS